MKLILAAIALACGLSCSKPQEGGVPSKAPDEPAKAALLPYEFESVEGRFSIDLPAEPKHLPNALAPDVVLHSHAIETSERAYFANYLELPPSSKEGRTDKAIISDSVTSALARFENPTTKISEISIDGHAGKRVSVVGDNGGRRVYVEMEIFQVGLMNYQLMLIDDETIPEELQTAFFSSFKLTPESPAPAEESATP